MAFAQMMSRGQQAAIAFARRRAATIAGLLVLAVVGETALRALGWRAFSRSAGAPATTGIAGRLVADPKLGFRAAKGSWQEELAGRTWRETRDATGARTTPGNPKNAAEIWVFGDAWTEGVGVDDGETYAARLQQRLPNYCVLNFGVEGYSFVQIEKLLHELFQGRAKPVVVILGYRPALDDFSTLDRRCRKKCLTSECVFTRFEQVPYGLFDNDRPNQVLPHSRTVDYRPLWGSRWSALVSAADDVLNLVEARWRESNRVTRQMLFNIMLETRNKGIALMVVGLQPDANAMAVFCNQQDIGWSPAWNSPRERPGFIDGVEPLPSARGHERIAERVFSDLVSQRLVNAAPAAVSAGG